MRQSNSSCPNGEPVCAAESQTMTRSRNSLHHISPRLGGRDLPTRFAARFALGSLVAIAPACAPLEGRLDTALRSNLA